MEGFLLWIKQTWRDAAGKRSSNHGDDDEDERREKEKKRKRKTGDMISVYHGGDNHWR